MIGAIIFHLSLFFFHWLGMPRTHMATHSVHPTPTLGATSLAPMGSLKEVTVLNLDRDMLQDETESLRFVPL